MLGLAARGALSFDMPQVQAELGKRLAKLPSVPSPLHGSGEVNSLATGSSGSGSKATLAPASTPGTWSYGTCPWKVTRCATPSASASAR